MAIQYIQKKYSARVLYIDTDAHHGDGVQFTFYDNPDVCTLSIHETGRYLFPGTGQIQEKGSGKGYGYSFNIPLDAFTEDDSFLEAYRTAASEVAAYFEPDVIISQNGADAHYYDPLTHLSATINIYEEIPVLHTLWLINIAEGNGLQSEAADMIFGVSCPAPGPEYGLK